MNQPLKVIGVRMCHARRYRPFVFFWRKERGDHGPAHVKGTVVKPSAVNQHVTPRAPDKSRRALADIDGRDFQMAGKLVFQNQEGGIGKNQRGADQRPV